MNRHDAMLRFGFALDRFTVAESADCQGHDLKEEAMQLHDHIILPRRVAVLYQQIPWRDFPRSVDQAYDRTNGDFGTAFVVFEDTDCSADDINLSPTLGGIQIPNECNDDVEASIGKGKDLTTSEILEIFFISIVGDWNPLLEVANLHLGSLVNSRPS